MFSRLWLSCLYKIKKGFFFSFHLSAFTASVGGEERWGWGGITAENN